MNYLSSYDRPPFLIAGLIGVQMLFEAFRIASTSHVAASPFVLVGTAFVFGGDASFPMVIGLVVVSDFVASGFLRRDIEKR